MTSITKIIIPGINRELLIDYDGVSRVIDSFHGEYFFLSNFSANALTAPTLEHWYQAAKSTDAAERANIMSAPTPAIAKKRGRAVKSLRQDWDSFKYAAMYALIKKKFNDPVLADKLLALSDAVLIEGNTWGDTVWGVCDGVGDNALGNILMLVSCELRGIKVYGEL